MVIKIGNNQYNIIEARSIKEKETGLLGREVLPKDTGMLFYYDPPQDVIFNMKEVKFPIDIIMINEEEEVTLVYTSQPGSTEDYIGKNVAYVLEVNSGSGITVGDSLEFDGPIMQVLFPDGSEQYKLWGEERIFSRKNTRVLIKKAKKAAASKEDKDYKALGKYMFKCIKTQDNREPEYATK